MYHFAFPVDLEDQREPDYEVDGVRDVVALDSNLSFSSLGEKSIQSITYNQRTNCMLITPGDPDYQDIRTILCDKPSQ